MSRRLADTLSGLGPTQVLRFPVAAWPLAEVLLTAQVARFTGRIVLRLGQAPGAPVPTGSDLIFLREGGMVGLERVGPRGARGVADILVEASELEPAEAEAFLGGATGGVDLCRRLEARGLVPRGALDRAVAEHARRRLLARASDESSMVEARAGLDALADFHPVSIDPRPAIAYGLVVHGRPADKHAIAKRVAHRRARLVAPYDPRRNAFGLPPPLLAALSELADGVELGERPTFGGLSWSDAAGLLLLMERIGLLEVEESVPRRSSISS